MYIKFDFPTRPLYRNEYDVEYDGETYLYEVEQKDLQKAIVNVVIDKYGFKDKEKIRKFIDDLDEWEMLEEKFEEQIKEYLEEMCYHKAHDKWYKENCLDD